jgi:tetratricopeptide (TPR) repeat protein
MRSSLARRRLFLTILPLLLSAVLFSAVSPLSSFAQMPQPGAPASDVSNIPKPVINTVDDVNMRNGPDQDRTAKKRPENKEESCLLPPLTLISSPIIDAEQLQVGDKAKREYQQACAALRRHKNEDAEKHLRRAVHDYPKYSAAWVTLGQWLAAQQRSDQAQQACLQASTVSPRYIPAYLCLADIAARGHDWNEVLKLSERALELDPSRDPLAYEYNAAANLKLQHLMEAEKSGLRAVAIDKDHREPRALFVLAQIYEAKGDTENEINQLREYLRYADNPEDISAVKHFLLQIENRNAKGRIDQDKAGDRTVGEKSPDVIASAKHSWAPADIDEVVPPVQSDPPCPIQQILKQTSDRTQDLIQSLQRFSADERIEQIEFDKNGKSRSANTQGNYVVQIEENASRYPVIKEYRGGNSGTHPSSVVDTGTAIFALIFHPSHIRSFSFRCEGLSQSLGSPAWQLHFEESADPNESFQAIRIGGSVYLPRLKGRAWIARNSYEVLRIETDLASPIPQIRFGLEHLVINYAPVEFKNHSVRLWLPESAQLYIAYRGHRYELDHSFSHFQLFSVDSDQAVKDPPPNKAPLQLLSVQSKLLEPKSNSR